MSEEVVERIESKDPKALKIFFLLFFLLIPISGVLLVWTDGHAKIRKQAERFANTQVIPAMMTMDKPAVLELCTPAFANKLRAGGFEMRLEEFGKLKSHSKLRPSNTRAREESDIGVIYAEIEFIGEFEKGTGAVWMTIKSQSTGEIAEDGTKRVEAWYVDDMEVNKR